MLRRLICISLALGILLCPAPAAEEETAELPILMYHDVRWERPGKDAVTPDELEGDLRWLASQGYTPVTMARAVDFVLEGKPLPPKPVVLSFDDGFQSAYLTVLPILEKYGFPMVLSVIAGSADEFSAYPGEDPRRAHAAWRQLRALADSGLAELQNHSYALHRCVGGVYGCDRRPGESPAAYEQRLAGDALLAQERLRTETGRAAQVFTYPYGRWSAESEAVLRELGFRATFTCDFGVNRLTHDPDCLFGLRRICRSHGADLADLLAGAAAFRKER